MPKHQPRPPLTVEQVLAWAEAHYERTGRWPTIHTGEIPDSSDESWPSINMSLAQGYRGLPSGSSLFALLDQHCGQRTKEGNSFLTVAQILKWAERHRKRTGYWPKILDGPVFDAPGETWRRIDTALRRGERGLPGGDSLPRLLRRHQTEQEKASGKML